ncbi:MAG: hypothetical protein Q7S40_28530 [Opitutaceae bacterium]|nr:hypothetical protein [Opitutaceae bacterium]
MLKVPKVWQDLLAIEDFKALATYPARSVSVCLNRTSAQKLSPRKSAGSVECVSSGVSAPVAAGLYVGEASAREAARSHADFKTEEAETFSIRIQHPTLGFIPPPR